jgi:hypothetical protein
MTKVPRETRNCSQSHHRMQAIFNIQDATKAFIVARPNLMIFSASSQTSMNNISFQ